MARLVDAAAAVPVEHVAAAIAQATNQDPSVFAPAAELLKSWETSRGFHLGLVEIMGSPDVPEASRWMATVCFKHGADRFWRRSAPNAIQEDEKQAIRERLIRCIPEPSPQIAKQMAVIISRIARNDVPNEWPALLPALFEGIQSPQPLLQHRALLFLYHTAKELASKRIGGRAVFDKMTDTVFSFVHAMWMTEMTDIVAALSRFHDQPALVTRMEYARLCLKTLRQLIAHSSFSTTTRDSLGFVQATMQCILALHTYRPAVRARGPDSAVLGVLDKTLVMGCKTLSDVLEHHPDPFAALLEPFLSLFAGEVFAAAQRPAGEGHERFTIFSLNLLRAVVLNQSYRPLASTQPGARPVRITSAAKTESFTAAAEQAHSTLHAFFSGENLSRVVNVLVSHFLALTPEDLATWQEAPETFAAEEETESWVFGQRAAAEHLLVALMGSYSEGVAPLLLGMLAALTPAMPLHYRDAVYSAVGRCAYYLHDHLDFGRDLLPRLAAEIAAAPDSAVLHRRAALLAGEWVNVRIKAEYRPAVYGMLQSLLGSSDLVVRLAAAEALANVLEDMDFAVDDFLPMAEDTFRKLWRLFFELSETEKTLRVLDIVGAFAERLGTRALFIIALLAETLGVAWQRCAAVSLLQTALVRTLTKVIDTFASRAEPLLPASYQIIAYSVDVRQPAHVYLIEHAMTLWLSVIRAHPGPAAPLLQLYPLLFDVVQRGDESLLHGLRCIEAYLLLAGPALLPSHGEATAAACLTLADQLPPEGVSLLCKIIDNVLVLFGLPGLQLFSRNVTYALRMVAVESDSNFTSHLSVCAHAILVSPDAFLALCAELSSTEQCNVFEMFVETVFDKFDVIIKEGVRKAAGLSLLSLAVHPQTHARLTQNLTPLVKISVSLVSYFHVRVGSFSSNDFFLRPATPPHDMHTVQPEYERLKLLSTKDPVYSRNVRDDVAQTFQALAALLGPRFQPALQAVHPPLRASFEALMAMKDGDKMT
eukprot:m.113892 g.113892  ORF g.113892 m.113892 type:complete len:990 (+) comp14401_c0_seq2:13-2982(+)